MLDSSTKRSKDSSSDLIKKSSWLDAFLSDLPTTKWPDIQFSRKRNKHCIHTLNNYKLLSVKISAMTVDWIRRINALFGGMVCAFLGRIWNTSIVRQQLETHCTVDEPDVSICESLRHAHTHFVVSVLTLHPHSVTQITLKNPALEPSPLERSTISYQQIFHWEHWKRDYLLTRQVC